MSCGGYDAERTTAYYILSRCVVHLQRRLVFLLCGIVFLTFGIAVLLSAPQHIYSSVQYHHYHTYSHLPSCGDLTSSDKRVKTIFHVGNRHLDDYLQFDFNGCEYSNCVLQVSKQSNCVFYDADVLLFSFSSKYINLKLTDDIRRAQLWIVYGMESPAYDFNIWHHAINDFNGTMTYLPSSTVGYLPYGVKKHNHNALRSKVQLDYAKGKSKGAFAYVSNCKSMHYDRLDLMNRLSQYIEIDIFGKCSNKMLCTKRQQTDVSCDEVMHTNYRFYLGFENSLCKDYITEKLWKALNSANHQIPVVVGGLSIAEYDKIAPPESFIHIYNFTSVDHLGEYLQELMTNDDAYNRYHHWRQDYHVVERLDATKGATCGLCKAANKPESLRAGQYVQFADEWNDPSNCRLLEQ